MVYLLLIEILTKIINRTNKETDLEALHPDHLWPGIKYPQTNIFHIFEPYRTV
jgi:hypothetical protein